MIIGLIGFAVYLYFFVGLGNILLAVQSFNAATFQTYHSLAVGAMVFNLILWVWSWRTLLGALNVKVNLKNAFLYYWTGSFVELVIPCQAYVAKSQECT